VLVVAAHVDSAHSGLVFNPGVLKWLGSRSTESQIPPALTLPFRGLVSLTAASVIRAIGLPRILAKTVASPGVFISLATAGFMADIGRRPVVPGANDDASAVATVLALARELAAEPPKNLEVWFLATGCEEAIEGGIHAFLERHYADLEGRRPFFLNLEMLGSGRPGYARAEGHITTFEMMPEAVSLVADVTREPEFADVEGFVSPAQSDALAAHHYGIAAVTVHSLPPEGELAHYHWPSDTPENINGASLERCYRYLRRIIERLDEEAG
jgi:Zn-dependent M28 family amino/carboxypeptidase